MRAAPVPKERVQQAGVLVLQALTGSFVPICYQRKFRLNLDSATGST